MRDRLTGAWVSLAQIEGQAGLRSVAADPPADPQHVVARVLATSDRSLAHISNLR